jgi:hypothetical protein
MCGGEWRTRARHLLAARSWLRAGLSKTVNMNHEHESTGLFATEHVRHPSSHVHTNDSVHVDDDIYVHSMAIFVAIFTFMIYV